MNSIHSFGVRLHSSMIHNRAINPTKSVLIIISVTNRTNQRGRASSSGKFTGFHGIFLAQGGLGPLNHIPSCQLQGVLLTGPAQIVLRTNMFNFFPPVKVKRAKVSPQQEHIIAVTKKHLLKSYVFETAKHILVEKDNVESWFESVA